MNVPKIDPAWRTDTVVQLCLSMRETQDFGAMPILADALQDAGCPETEQVLADLRACSLPSFAEIIIGAILSDEVAAAVKWVEEYAAGYDGSDYGDSCSRLWTYEDFMTAARRYLEYGDYITGGSEMEGERVSDTFWEKYQIITGRPLPEDKIGNFFSCSC